MTTKESKEAMHLFEGQFKRHTIEVTSALIEEEPLTPIRSPLDHL